jgi:hypothetical protein
MHRARLLCETPLWRLPSLQADRVRLPGGLARLGSESRQPPVRAMLSPFGHLSNDLRLPFLETRNQALSSPLEMSCRLLGHQEMPFLLPSIFPASARHVPPCIGSQAELSRMQDVAMHQRQQRNCPTVPQPVQFLAGPILRFPTHSPVSNYRFHLIICSPILIKGSSAFHGSLKFK